MGKKKDRWPELCKLVENSDNLPVRDVGPWTVRKLYFWNRYIDITTSSMSSKRAWSAGVVYVDLFAGPGICEVRTTKQRIPGSVLIAANAPTPFRKILACEMDSKLALACEQRLANSPAANISKVLAGDCNERIYDLVKEIPDRALSLAFADPEGLDARFETILTLTTDRRVDLLVLFADAYDIVRNVELLYLNDPNSKLDLMLGPDSKWRDQWNAMNNRDGTTVRQLFSEIYKDQLRRHLGYERFGEYVIKSDRGPLYRLIFASKSPRGLEFWHKCLAKDETGQMTLGF
jgi:three-Cys-motif partner protein